MVVIMIMMMMIMISQIPAPIHICPQYPILCSSTHPIARWYVGSGHAAPPISHSIIPSPVHWSLLAQVIGASYQQFVPSIHFSPGSLSFPWYVGSLSPQFCGKFWAHIALKPALFAISHVEVRLLTGPTLSISQAHNSDDIRSEHKTMLVLKHHHL